MSGFIVDESKFMLEDEESDAYFNEPYRLPDGIVIDALEDETDKWQLYLSEDGAYEILCVRSDLKDRWISSGLLQESDFQKIVHADKELYLLFSPSSIPLARLTSVRVKNSCRYALSLYSAFVHTRQLDVDSNLRDGIYFGLNSVILPCYSLVGAVSDRALFENALRSRNDPENLSAPNGINDSLNFTYVKRLLKKKGIELPDNEILFEAGESVDDFTFGKEVNALITSPVIIRDHYQLFDTTSRSYLLIMDSLWAEALLSTTLISLITLNSVAISGRRYYVLTLRKDLSTENLNDRFYGVNDMSATRIARAIRRTRAILPECQLKQGLYIESMGIVLPEHFSKGNSQEDSEIMRECLANGPFATAPLLDEISLELIRAV
ncbi:MAG: hypothetical protein ACI4M9_01725 [Succinivibrio sp.]